MARDSIRPSIADLQDESFLEEFLSATSTKPAATAIRGRPPPFGTSFEASQAETPTIPPPLSPSDLAPDASTFAPPKPSRLKSRFALQRQREAEQQASSTSSDVPLGRFALNLSDEDTSLPPWQAAPNDAGKKKIVGEIVERDEPSQPVESPSFQMYPSGFPPTNHDTTPRTSATHNEANTNDSTSFASTSMPGSSFFSATRGGNVLSPSTHDQISRDNDVILAGMNSEEIIREQKEIRSILAKSNPQLLAALIKPLARSSERPPLPPSTSTSKHLRFAEEPPEYFSPSSNGSASSSGGEFPSPVQTKHSLMTLTLNEPATTTESFKLKESLPTPSFNAPLKSRFLPMNEKAQPDDPVLSVRPADPAPSPGFRDTHPSTNKPVKLAFSSGSTLHDSIESYARSDDVVPSVGPSHLLYNLEGSIVGTRFHVSRGFHDEHHSHDISEFELHDLITLTMSSIAAQRVIAFRTLWHIIDRNDMDKSDFVDDISPLIDEIVKCSIKAINDRNLGVSDSAVRFLEIATRTFKRQILQKVVHTCLESNEMRGRLFAGLNNHFEHVRLSPPALDACLSILEVLVTNGGTTAGNDLLSTPSMVESILAHTISLPWPPAPKPVPLLPSSICIRLLVACSRSSKQHASALLERGVAAPLLRYLALPYWSLPALSRDDQATMSQVTTDLLHLLISFAGYGLGTFLRSDIDAVLRSISTHLANPTMLKDTLVCQVVSSYLRLWKAWMECAIDNHVTEPAHSISWSQMVELGEEACNFVEAALEAKSNEVVVVALQIIELWTTESIVKRLPVHNVAQRMKKVLPLLQDLIASALSRMMAGPESWLAIDCDVVSSILLLSCYNNRPFQSTLEVFSRVAILGRAVEYSLLSVEAATVATALALHSRESGSTQKDRHLDEVLLAMLVARNSQGALLHNLIERALQQATLYFDGPDPASVLSLAPAYKSYVSEASANVLLTHRCPQHITAQLRQNGDAAFVFPDSWPLLILSFHSQQDREHGLSQMKVNDMIKLALQLMLRIQQAINRSDCDLSSLRTTPIWAQLWTLFLFERGRHQYGHESKSEDDAAFRDPEISQLIHQLLLYRDDENSLSRQSSSINFVPDGEEEVSIFYEHFIDLLGLYDSMSFADLNFSRVLIPPLSMTWPLRFRRLLFSDYGHLLKTIRLTLDMVKKDFGSVVTVDGVSSFQISNYFWPIESNEVQVGMYCRALSMREVEEAKNSFMYMFTLHHLAHGVWNQQEQEQQNGSKRFSEKVRISWIKATLASTDSVCRTVLLYNVHRQTSGIDIPQCLDISEQEKETRMSWIRQWAEPTLIGVAERVLLCDGM